MSVLRVKKDKNYFAASNIPFNDERLSWEARGVMGYLLSKPDDWQVMLGDLINQSPAGEYKMSRILKELEKHGYLVRKRIRDESGKFTWRSTVYEKPTIPRKSRDGKTIPQLSTDGKPPDIPNTELPSTESDDDDQRPNSFAIYEENIGPLTGFIGETITKAEEDYTTEWVEEAIREAVKHGGKTWSYVDTILKNWKTFGYKADLKKNGKSNGNGRKSNYEKSIAAINKFAEED